MEEDSWALRRGREEERARRQRARLQAAYGAVGLALLEVLVACDPLQLVAQGAAPEQYTHEASTLALRLSAATTEAEAARLVTEVLEETAGPGGDGGEHRYQVCAAEVWRVWQELVE